LASGRNLGGDIASGLIVAHQIDIDSGCQIGVVGFRADLMPAPTLRAGCFAPVRIGPQIAADPFNGNQSRTEPQRIVSGRSKCTTLRAEKP